MKTVRIGVLSTAKIGRTKVIPGMRQASNCEVTAIASRDEDRARRAALELNIPKAYGSYEDLLGDPDIDAVYIPLPNHLHTPWAKAALEAGKHVLCEKPVALTSDEAQTLLDAAAEHPKLKIMEAFMYRFHPQWIKTAELVRSGAIGETTAIQSFFSYYNDDPANIRNMADIGGGGLMDIGCYSISLSRLIFDSEPERVAGFSDIDPEFNTDRLFSGMMDFGGRISSFTCSTQLTPYQQVDIFGTTGRIQIPIPFNAPPDRPCIILLQDDAAGVIETITFDAYDQYAIQAELFAEAILENTDVPTPLSDAFDNMHVLETLARSARLGEWLAC
ncbi:Gfo/Idh/MocA family oxidoreductase [Pseudodesulfovibrio thermohalotolerans]|uniref:Gfo/Idh/MocA family protein n=1 Tax=Pseudodesulfovibrio thermohalotolerans TaxID=2880651 RepID=UPI002441294F|nr:Gfo/Idh/MocA family oxidoreductase [Pseudodesulfovibrio thermohalotolerans]WFS63182.1 Gfo/Idh/MocA family oxidoreductase [Pseudodesulfovibrio thermohalotolerans]